MGREGLEARARGKCTSKIDITMPSVGLPNAKMDLKSKLRMIPDFPKPGINFVDITPLLGDAKHFRGAVDAICSYFEERGVDAIVGIEARGFVLGAPVAYKLGVGFVPARKKGKLPAQKLSAGYTLEYSTEYMEMHADSLRRGERVGIVDDLLATGGTAEATASLVEKLGGEVRGIAFLVELDFLHGRNRLAKYDLKALVHFPS
jgi:adenine phosphoribosyltransferase